MYGREQKYHRGNVVKEEGLDKQLIDTVPGQARPVTPGPRVAGKHAGNQGTLDPQRYCSRPATPLVDPQRLVGRSGKPEVGAQGPDKPVALKCGRKEELRLDVAEAELRTDRGRKRRLPDHGSDPARYQVEVWRKPDRDHGLDEKHVLRAAKRSHAGTRVVLIDDAVQGRQRSLRLTGRRVVGCRRRSSHCRSRAIRGGALAPISFSF